MTVIAPTDKNDRYPIEIVARTVWLYFRFNLSLRDVEEMLLDRGIVFPTIPSADGAESMALIMRAAYAARRRRKAMSRTSMKSLCASTVRNTGCGERLIRTDMCSTRSSRHAVTPRRPSAC
ncbi:putative transposase [Rhizobium ruizarguesonis]|jgi:putative transposase